MDEFFPQGTPISMPSDSHIEEQEVVTQCVPTGLFPVK